MFITRIPSNHNTTSYTVPKIATRMLTYDECSDDQFQGFDSNSFLKRLVSEKVKRKDTAQCPFEEEKENLAVHEI